MAEGEPVGNSARRAYQDLEAFAERSRRADEQTALIAGLPPPLERAVIYLIVAALAITLAILYVGRMQTVVETRGTILVPGNAVTLQAGQRGVVTEISAAPGEYLEAGAVVLRIDTSSAALAAAQAGAAGEAEATQLRTLLASRDSLARAIGGPVMAGAASPDHTAPAGTLAPSTVDALKKLDEARTQLDAAEAKLTLVPERRRTLEGQVMVAEARLAKLQPSLAGSGQAIARGEVEAEISRTRLELAELNTALRAIEDDSRAEASAARTRYGQAFAGLLREHDTIVIEVRELESRIAQASRAGGNAGPVAVTMPVAGTIAALEALTVGDVVTAGAPVATISPGAVALMVETRATSKDIGFVRPGVAALIKVDAFPFQQFGTARAQVKKVQPAAGADGSFVVQLELVDRALTAGGAEHRLFPGLTVQADVITGRQRLLDVLLHGRAGGAAGTK